jgi:hypothetical protein
LFAEDSFKTAYLIPDGRLRISFVAAAFAGDLAIPMAPRAAAEDEMNVRRLLVESKGPVLMDKENPLAPPQKMAAVETRAVVVFIVSRDLTKLLEGA